MKKAIRLFSMAMVMLAVLALSSCSKEESGKSKNSVYGTYWEGTTTVVYHSGFSVMTADYNLQIYFEKETVAICRYTLYSLIPLRDVFTMDYTMKDDKTVVCTVESSAGGSYQETGVISADGNTMTYHTKVVSDDESSWTDIILTKKPVPTN